ncbi:MAG: hypothetical protein FWG90_02785 [Oscillospiraceae bacterium]|nr:hypothetical protein [Oscillospiraceae bacterium]
MYANFMKHNFSNYYAPDGKGGYKEVTRGVCFAYDKESSFSGKYPQRWYWDVQNSFAIRLERNEKGKRIYNEARAERRRAAKDYLEMYGCVRKECMTCKGYDEVVRGESKCDSCANHVTFIVLDEELDNSDGAKGVPFEIRANVDVEQQVETSFLLETLHEVLQTLDRDEQELWRFLVADTKKKVIAAHFGWTLDKLSCQQLRLYTKLRTNRALRNFF